MRPSVLLWVIAVSACGRTGPYGYREPPPIPRDAGGGGGAPDGGTDWCAIGINGGCDPKAICTNHPAARNCACKPGYTGDGFSCTGVAASLDGLRWELPCLKPEPQAPDYVCLTTPAVTRTATLSGVPGRTYDIRLRLRGVVETKLYLGGPTIGGYWAPGTATPSNDAWNIYRLSISSPQASHYLNHGQSGLYQCVGIDYELTVRANGGAAVTLFASAVDSNLSEIRNNVASPIVVPGVPPAPLPYDGQFIQMDVLDVTEAP